MALEEIINRYTPYVLTVISNQLGSFFLAEDAEELASNVFFALWSKRRLILSDRLQGWLAAVARNEARGYLRKRKLDTAPLEDYLLLEGEDAEDLLEEQERREYLKAALDAMDGSTREIFIRYFYYGQTVSVIAREMNMNLSTVKSRLLRGKEKLRVKLEEGGDFL